MEAALRQWLATELPDIRRSSGWRAPALLRAATGAPAAIWTCWPLCGRTAERFERRANAWNLTQLPVPADLVVYTEAEWDALRTGGARFAQVVEREGRWLYP